VPRFSNNAIFKRILSPDYFLTFLLFDDLVISYLFGYMPRLIYLSLLIEVAGTKAAKKNIRKISFFIITQDFLDFTSEYH